jgi:hypothetical protein
MSKRNIYALLVGIDDYPIASHKLNGCVNDVNAMHEFLEFRCNSEDIELKVLKLLDKEATKANVVKGFLEHLGTATNQDDAFFYYSGHGAQEVAPPEFWQIEPDKLNESMVCADSRTETGGEGDLVDKEIGYLLWKVSKNNPRLVVVMDCCHSGSGTRSAAPSKADITTRQIPLANKMRNVKDYLGFEEGYYQIRADGQVMMKRGNYVSLAAARANEFAKETTLDGQKRGAFNFSLIETLKSAKGDLSYGDLMSKVKAKVISLVPEQNPQLEICVPTQVEGAVELANLDRTFLGGLPPKEDFLRIYYRDDLKSWVVNFGQMQGLPKNPSADPNILSVFSFADASGNKEYKLSTDANKGNDIAQAVISKVEKDFSRVNFQDHPNRNTFAPDVNAIYKAKLTSSSVKAVLFCMEGKEEDTQYLKKMVETDSGSQPYAKFTDNQGEAKYKVVVSQDQFTKRYEFLLNQDGKKVCKDVKGKQGITTQNSLQVGEGAMAQQAWSYVQTIAKWEKTLEMNNPDTSFSDNSVVIEVIDSKEIGKKVEEQLTMNVANGLNLVANQEYEGTMLTPDVYWRVKNNTSKQLYCTALWMSQNFGVDLTSEASLQIFNRSLPPNTSFDILDGSPVNLAVNGNLLLGGEFQEKIVIKLIYSTEEFSPDFVKNMTLIPLPFPATPDEDSNTRGLVKKASGADWSVFNLFVTVTQPSQTQKVLAGKPAGLLGKNSISSNFAGGVEVALASPQQQVATRDVSQKKAKDFGIPSVFQENKQFEPISFNNQNGDTTDLNILEIKGIANLQKTDESKPLFDLKLDAQAEEGDVVFPITFDGEFFLPIKASSEVNENGEVTVSVDNLPKDASEPKIDPETQTRSLGGSVKIFFQKVVSKKLGREFQYPLLDMATDINASGFTYLRKVHSDKDYGFVLDQMAQKIEDKSVKNIAVFVHGIIGDTEAMPQSLLLGKDAQGNPLLNKYDAVLTLDYENLNTPIESNAQFFKERLEHLGLKAGHDKNLHIYAHSMGGLVSRYMIENLRGDDIANHLIMLGTPNGGSPISALKDWIQMAISMAMSKLAMFAWATAPMVFLFNKTMKEIGVSLKQLNGNEPFLQNLAKTVQPKTPYTIIAGNTKMTPLLTEGTPESGSLHRLLGKIQSKVLDEFLFGSPNDIAVSLDSIKNVKWVKEEEIIYSACDHLSYFSSEEGTKAMVEAASRAKFL